MKISTTCWLELVVLLLLLLLSNFCECSWSIRTSSSTLSRSVFYHIETGHLFCPSYQLIGFYMRETVVNGLTYSPANICLFKISNRNTRKRCKICSKLTIKTPERRHFLRWFELPQKRQKIVQYFRKHGKELNFLKYWKNVLALFFRYS